MEIVKLDVHGYYFYRPDLQMENYDKHVDKKKLLSDCAICKRSILDSSYEAITNLEYVGLQTQVTIGKCGHMFHTECINNWIKTNNICPIDKIGWQTFRIADTQTKLTLKSDSKSLNFDDKLNKFSKDKTGKYIEPIKTIGKYNKNYVEDDKLLINPEPENLLLPLEFWFTQQPVGINNIQPVNNFEEELVVALTEENNKILEDVD